VAVELHTDLGADGLVVRDGFESPGGVQALLECARLRDLRGEFSAARVGSELGRLARREIRGDVTCWLDEPAFDAERALLARLETLRLDLNRSAWLGLFDLELHYARYPIGAGYARHVDQPQGRAQRRVSVILYLNAAWQPGDGGELRVFDAAGGHRDVEPVAGRLVCFSTAEREHAVLPTAVERSSISGWFRTRE